MLTDPSNARQQYQSLPLDKQRQLMAFAMQHAAGGPGPQAAERQRAPRAGAMQMPQGTPQGPDAGGKNVLEQILEWILSIVGLGGDYGAGSGMSPQPQQQQPQRDYRNWFAEQAAMGRVDRQGSRVYGSTVGSNVEPHRMISPGVMVPTEQLTDPMNPLQPQQPTPVGGPPRERPT